MMARARNIKPGFFQNADLVELSMEARLLFIGLWMLADRAGRLLDRPKQIKMDIFPADSLDCNALLDDLAATGMLLRYEVDGKRYLQVVNFVKHQNPHRDEKASTIPDQYGNLAGKTAAPEKHGASTVQAQCQTDAPTIPAQVAPDADTVPIGLNPDPRILNPETLTTHTAREATGVGAAVPAVCVSICQKMQEVGVKDANAADAELARLIGAGADAAVFVDAAAVAAGKQRGFGYALGVVRNRLADAAAGPAVAAGGAPARVSAVWHESAAGVDRMAAELGLPPLGEFEQRPAFKARVMAAAAVRQAGRAVA